MTNQARHLVFRFFLLWAMASALCAKEYTFSIVPQQSAQQLAATWQPLFEEVYRQSGIKLLFRTAPSIPEFESRLAEEEYDFAYMNPYHYTVFSKSAHYQAIAKAKDKKINGILVVPKDSPAQTLSDLANKRIAFPAPLAFAATLLTQSHLQAENVPFESFFVRTHDSVYLNVSQGFFDAGGGVMRTFNNMPDNIRAQLRILWTTPGYTPHAIAYHERIPKEDYQAIQQALIGLERTQAGQAALKALGIHGFAIAVDADWDDVRQLHIDL